MTLYGSEKWIFQETAVRRWAYRLFGEVNVPGRLRSYHVIRTLRGLGLTGRPLHMLDAGCGKGDLALHLARCYPHWQVLGVDADAVKVRRANTLAVRLGLSNLRFQTALLEDLDLDSQFDLIISADVLEHIQDDSRVIANFCRAARPGGYILVTSPSIPQPWHLPTVKWRERKIRFHPSQYGHVRQGYDACGLARKFSAAGAELLLSRFTFGFFGTLAFDLFFTIGDNRPNPLVFAIFFPWLMLLAALDLWLPCRHGAAILAVARRPMSDSTAEAA
jgi:2-polyprenyl-3-methyl-5-hydroxy-6-metoxy-1,4-benzoquinol methylase